MLFLNRCYLPQLTKRKLSVFTPALQQVISQSEESNCLSPTDATWSNARDFESIPGPSRIGFFRDHLPGGRLHNVNMVEMNRKMRQLYGDIYRIKGMFGKPDLVATYNAKDFETIYRNEGLWPLRTGLDSFQHYRQQKRPDVFNGVGGLVSEQGEDWARIRSKVNPIVMKLQNVRQNLPEIDLIASEFLAKLEASRDPATNLLTIDFMENVKMLAFESISYIALNIRMGLFTPHPDPNALKLAKSMADFFQYSFVYDVVPSFWKYVETPGFKRLMRTLDNITDITSNYIDAAVQKFKMENNVEAKSVLEKLCRVDQQIAFVMAMDMLMAGTDTTSSALLTTLYLLARNPEKQRLLQKELKEILPDPNSPLTIQNTTNMPYLRACIKEALRIMPITPVNARTTVTDLVLSGYKIPKGTLMLMNVMALSNTEAYFPRSSQFLPERWLKSGQSACPENKATNPFVYLPFGFGPRTCIGKRMAEMQLETVLAKLLRTYTVAWAAQEDMQYKSNIILSPDGDVQFSFTPIS